MKETPQYLLGELEYVRKNYDAAIEKIRQLERYVVVITGLTWGWCATNIGRPGFVILIWFPAFACLLFGLRAVGIHYRTVLIRRYLVKLETKINVPDELGWGRELSTFNHGMPLLITITSYLFWGMLQIGTVIVPILYGNP